MEDKGITNQSMINDHLTPDADQDINGQRKCLNYICSEKGVLAYLTEIFITLTENKFYLKKKKEVQTKIKTLVDEFAMDNTSSSNIIHIHIR